MKRKLAAFAAFSAFTSACTTIFPAVAAYYKLPVSPGVVPASGNWIVAWEDNGKSYSEVVELQFSQPETGARGVKVSHPLDKFGQGFWKTDGQVYIYFDPDGTLGPRGSVSLDAYLQSERLMKGAISTSNTESDGGTRRSQVAGEATYRGY